MILKTASRQQSANPRDRAIGFNKTKVDRYMQLLQATIFDESGNRAIHEGNIFNVDESGFIICHKPEL